MLARLAIESNDDENLFFYFMLYKYVHKHGGSARHKTNNKGRKKS